MKSMKTGLSLAMGMAVAVWNACGVGPPEATYKSGPGILMGRVQAEFIATGPKGGGRDYRARAEASIRLRRIRAPDGRIAVELQVDSVAYSGSERDAEELAFMCERLRRYRAVWRMTPDGHVADLSEEPELPRGEFTCRLGPMLAAALPVLRVAGSGAGADTQSLFDVSESEAAIVQVRMGADGKTGKNLLRGRRACRLWLGAPGDGAELAGESDFQFDPDLGFPRGVSLDLTGEFSPDQAGGQSSAQPMRMRYQYRFELIEVAAPEGATGSERPNL